MVINFRDRFGETGGLIEDLLGGDSVKPKADLALVDSMFRKGELFRPDHKKNKRLKNQIEILPGSIKELLVLAEKHQQSTYRHVRATIRTSMFAIKRQFDHEFLHEALLRYSINALPDDYTPWEPGPVTENSKKRNEFIGEVQGQICELFKVTDYNKVRFYSTVGSPLDLLYSTDGVFVVDGSLFPDGKRRVLPIDISGNINKADKGFNPSGSLILYLDMETLDDSTLENYRDSFAHQITKTLLDSSPDRMLDGFVSKFDQDLDQRVN